MDYFKKLLQLLHTERKEDRRIYESGMKNMTIVERRDNGLSWYPIVIKDTEFTKGDYLVIEVERPSFTDIQHQFRFGSSVALFSNFNAANDRIEGVISYQGGDRMKITTRIDEMPDWTRGGKLGVDLLFDDNSYEEMKLALERADKIADDNKLNGLIPYLVGEKKPGFEKSSTVHIQDALNTSQQKAVQQIIDAEQLAIVHGPPGTGKTTTLIAAIQALIAKGEKQILVTAPSNTAVDLLADKLSSRGLNVLRIGNPARVSDKLMSLTLDSKIANHSMSKELKKMRKQASEFRNMAHKYKRNFGPAEREQRKALFDEARKIMKSVEDTEQYIINDLLGRAQVIAATLVGASHYSVRHLKYTTLVIDEAGQALEPAGWIPIIKAQKLVLAGDHCQLPPTIKSDEAAKQGLSITLMEKLVEMYPETVTLLEEQYRMNEQIMRYPSSVFYENRLMANSSVRDQRLFNDDKPFLFIDTAGYGFEEKTEGTGTHNPEEAAFLFKHLAAFVEEIETQQLKEFPSIAIISPYRLQVLALQHQLENTSSLQAYLNKIAVNTIDSFQGQERDVVYISLTRSNSESRIGFLSEIRRMNVAMTRAKKKLVVIGDSSTLSQFPFYADLIDYAQQNDFYHSAWEWMG